MKSLIITSRYPYNYFGGDATRSINLINYASKLGFEVDLLCFNDEKLKLLEKKKDLNKQFIIYNPTNLSKYIHIIKSIFKGKPIQCSYFINKKTINFLKNFDFDKYDKIFIFLTRLAPILDFIENKNKVIFDMADILTINYKNAWKAKGLSLKWKLIYSIEYFLIKKTEKKLLKSNFQKLLVSERDYKYALKYLEGNKNNLNVLPSHFPNFDLKKIEKKAKNKFTQRYLKKTFRICFIGNMNAQHNHSSIVAIVKSKIIKKLNSKDITLTVVGKMNKEKENFYKSNSINVISNPKNLIKSAAIFDCGISLLRHCSGLQNKLYDYALLGIPIIASKESAEGIGFKNKKHYLLVNNEFEFYQNALFLKKNPKSAYKLTLNCATYISEKYYIDNIVAKLSKILS